MAEKIIFSTRINEEAVKNLKHLSVDEGRSLGNLLEEAIQDLLKKYEKKPTKTPKR
ncbi:MAG: ribbon-helix-helix domain-containing protein [Syntrophales bacterium LBB04]|nr:ribbon-helix-helix domain-containing protein [Syntrophales bacterium LBB04]